MPDNMFEERFIESFPPLFDEDDDESVPPTPSGWAQTLSNCS